MPLHSPKQTDMYAIEKVIRSLPYAKFEQIKNQVLRKHTEGETVINKFKVYVTFLFWKYGSCGSTSEARHSFLVSGSKDNIYNLLQMTWVYF